MFDSLLDRVVERVETLERFLSLCETWDDVATTDRGLLALEMRRRKIPKPNHAEERIFRHCTVVTQLYSVYESFCEDLLAAWLAKLPSHKLYIELSEPFRNAYRSGIGRLIQDLSKRRYAHLQEADVLAKYHACLAGDSDWEFVSEALTNHETNLRRESLEQMFSSVDLKDLWKRLEESPEIERVKEEENLNQSLEQLLSNFVNYRNEAAHGRPDEILGTEALYEWVYFVLSLCIALSDYVVHRVVFEQIENNPSSVIGEVKEVFKGKIAIVELKGSTLCVGERVFFYRDKDCISAEVVSMQVEGEECRGVSGVVKGFEVGVRVTSKLRKKTKVVAMDRG